METIIRPASLEDAEALLDIYAYYVENTAITFEYTTPSLEEFRRRIAGTLQKYPYLCAVRDGQVLGYACAGPFASRAAYGWAAETTIYLRRDVRGGGLGRRLCTALEEALKAMGVLNLYARIAAPPEEEDEYLTRNSTGFHAHMGYRTAGRFSRCGCKFDRWYDMVCMEKFLGDHREHPAPVRPYPETRRPD